MVVIRESLHKHPLAFRERDDGELAHCSNKCSACGEKPSGSFYLCSLCHPPSPFFHKSCVDDIPREFKINYRPHCTFLFKGESSSSNMPDCDFCNKPHVGHRFCCDVCDFQIGFGCVAKLIKYHKAGECLEHFSHRHPLNLLSQKVEKLMLCFLCYGIIEGKCYGCVPCQFYLHDTCREFPREIRHSFHPSHYLTLIINGHQNNYGNRCDACHLYIGAPLRYQCSVCAFNLHPECTLLKGNFKYSGHGHPLTLFENMSVKSTCQACGFDIQGCSFLRCVQCHLDFHVQCDSLQLPSTTVSTQHEHPLALSTKNFVNNDSCNVCKKETSLEHPFYYCAECKYFAHVLCAVTEMRHFSHQHILILHENRMNDGILCYGCGKGIQGPAYGCNPCKRYLHKHCAELPRQILHHLHVHDKHYLTLELSATLPEHKCDNCGKHLNGFVYHCRDCNFSLDLECVNQENIAHFSCDQHPLIILEKQEVDCKLCYKNICGQSYGCASCEFFIHKKCGELTTEIQHPFHPRHSLQLRIFKSIYKCNACHSEGQGIRYHCDICDFHLHPECGLPLPNIRYKGHQEHLLKLVENISYQSQCKECGFEIQGTFFLRCVECDMDFHVRCGSLPFPPNIVHEKHEHPLALSTKTHVKYNSDRLVCSVCQEERNIEHPVYCCDTCKYYAHIRCAISEIQVDEREKLKHFSHQHLLFLLINKRNYGTICSACKRDIQTDSAYGCDNCEFYLHKSCAELPSERQHPFHRHSLTLPQPYVRMQIKCSACRKDFGGFTYSCQGCQFHLDLDCSLLLPSMHFESHEHPLTYFKSLPDSTECKVCMSNSPDKFNPVSYFRCVKCDFNVHLLCSSLPQIIKYGRHRHPLTLTDNFVDLVDHCYDDEYYCDVCENKRDARECVYYCTKCSFVVDLDCVITEVIHSLQENRGDVQLRSVRKKGSRYKDILESLTEEEKKTMQHLKQEINEELKQIKEAGNEANERFLKLFSDLDKNSVQSMVSKSKIMSVERLDAGFKDDQVVKVQEYTIIPKFSELLRNLLDKYVDIGASSTLTQRLKTILLVIFCETVNSMSNTNVSNIDGDLIIKWWAYLELVHKAGFSIDFAFDHLKKVAHARFVVCDVISDSRSSLLYELYEQKNQLQQEIDERMLEVVNLRKREDQLSKEIEERMERVENLKKRVQDTISGRATDRSKSKAKRWFEALELWWKNIPLQ